MPTVNLTFPVQISQDEQGLLCAVLGCKPPELGATLSAYGPAALREYIEMFTGSGPISTATDIRERRLVGLMLHRTKGATPDADEVARLFNMTPSAARALLRAVAGKHRLKIKDNLERAIKATLGQAKQPEKGKPYTVVIRNGLIVELLNAELGACDVPKTPIRPSGDSINNFAIDKGSYDYLVGLHP